MTDKQRKALQEKAVKKLKAANEAIFEAELALIKLNEPGFQFDYASHPHLSSVFDGVKIKLDHCEKIIYQKKR
jgi:hypothetical protein